MTGTVTTTNAATAADEGRTRRRPSRQVVTARATDSLREEAVADDGTAREWRAVTNYFEDYIMTQHAAANTWENQKGVRPQSHRFTPAYADEKTGKIYGGLRYIRDNCPPSRILTTAMFTRTGWPYDTSGNAAPPVDYLTGLSEGRKAALRRLRSRLDSTDAVKQWGRLTVREPHTERRAGYPHAHDGVAIVADRPISAEELRPVMDAYLEANPFARPCDHGEDAVTVDHADDSDGEPAMSLAAELTNDMLGYHFDGSDGNPLTDADDAHRRFAALLWATGKQTVLFGNTFREWVRQSQHGWQPDDHDDGDSAEVPPPTDDRGAPEYIEPDPVSVDYEYPDE